MNKRAFYYLAALSCCCSFGASAVETQSQMKARMTGDLEVIHSFFDSRYAPRAWKGDYLGWDLDGEAAAAAANIRAADPVTSKKFHNILQNFMNTTADYHVGIWFNSTEAAKLPFRVKGVNGRYFVSFIDSDKFPPDVYGIQEGDELISFDGRAPDDVIREIIRDKGMSARPATDRYFAEIFLTNRMGKAGFTVPKGPIALAFRPRNSKAIKHFQLVWDYTPEKVSRPELQTPSRGLVARKGAAAKKSPLDKHLNRMMISPFELVLEPLRSEHADDKNIIGSRSSFVPRLGEVIWVSEESSPFDAYIYLNEDGRAIGYVRIPSYMGDNAAVQSFGELMKSFQDTTEALVIDQINNPGGNLYYCYSLTSMLTETPLMTPLHRFAITADDVEDAINENEIIATVQTNEDAVLYMEGQTDFFGIPVTYQMIRQIYDFNAFIIDQWREGKDLTDLHHVESAAFINPNTHVRYTKPILVIINEGDISGGDFFPAILKDNNRALLFGTRTAGAGGFTIMESFPNKSAIAGFCYTVSIANRHDGFPLEDLGVDPDIYYELTVEDLESGYIGYAAAINESVGLLLPYEGDIDWSQYTFGDHDLFDYTSDWPTCDWDDDFRYTYDWPTYDGPTCDWPTWDWPTWDWPTCDWDDDDFSYTYDWPTYDGPTCDWPTWDWPTWDWPTYDGPTYDLPEIEVPVIK